ncbi:MAG: hypothetical protein KGJ55_10665 [Gammaproteobacteria bacterium]|nr:hypothetical protein [Gammaproteobacteria bacterium]
MRDSLYLRLHEPSLEAPCNFAVVPAVAGAAVVEQASLATALARAQGLRLVVLVSSDRVRLTKVEVPLRQPGKVLQAVPFLLEDQFAEDVEDLHFALGPRQTDQSFPVAAVSRRQMEAWLAPLRQAGVEAELLLPEVLCLPWQHDGNWSVLPESEQVTVRTGVFSGFCCAPEDLETFLELAEDSQPRTLRVVAVRGSGSERFAAGARAIELLPGYADALEALIRGHRPEYSINLLQGIYSRHNRFDRIWHPWRLAAGLAAAVFTLGVADNIAHSVRDAYAAQRLQTANAQTFKTLFPDQPVTADLALQIRQQQMMLASSDDQTSLLPLLSMAASALQATPGLSLQTVQYHDHALYLDLTGANLQPLEKLRDWFAGHHGARLEVQTADAGENGVHIRVKLSAAA